MRNQGQDGVEKVEDGGEDKGMCEQILESLIDYDSF